MNRFYENVETVPEGDGWAVLLDGKSIKTPAKQSLILPTIGLAERVAQEWQEQDKEIVPLSMPLTRFANATIDRTRMMRTDVIAQICAYAQSDVLCYRVDEPADFVERQMAEWQPILDWLSASRGISLRVTAGIVQIDQDRSALEAVKNTVSALNDFALTGLHSVTTGFGSIALGLALADGHIDCEKAVTLATLEEIYQMEIWGEDSETIRRHDELRQEVLNADQFMTLAVPGA
ncbi:MAG: ATP12 family chaperone protein [Alphaproteobacteria bacterium]